MEAIDDGADLVGKAPNPRGPVREALREEDPLARARRRTAELREHIGDSDEQADRYYVDPTLAPNGWVYEWKRRLLLGAEDPAYMVNLARAGWEAVPAQRHPEMMPIGAQYKTIERDGMVLMERPLEIQDAVRDRELRKARQQVRVKEEQLNAVAPGQFERANKDQSLVKVNRSYEHIPIPD